MVKPFWVGFRKFLDTYKQIRETSVILAKIIIKIIDFVFEGGVCNLDSRSPFLKT